MGKKLSLVIISLLMVAHNAVASSELLHKLKDFRDKIIFPQLSREEKRNIIKATIAIFEKGYVNYEYKKNLYHIDPVVKLRSLENQIEILDDKKFHDVVIRAYNSFRDAHLNYYFPLPYRCTIVQLPIKLSKFGKDRVIVSSFTQNPVLFPEISKITLGDELIRFDDIKTDDYLQEREPYSQGSTQESMLSEGIVNLYFRPLGWNFVPEKNEAKLTFKKEDGSHYSLRAPWMVTQDQSCMDLSSKIANTSQGSKYSTFQKKLLGLRGFAKSFFARFPNFNSKKKGIDLSNLKRTNSEDLAYKEINFKGSAYGYIKIKTFDDNNGESDLFYSLKKILKVDLSHTKGIIIDLRSNPGGIIPLAERMAALLNPPNSQALPFYVKANKQVLRYHEDTEYTDESRASDDTSSGTKWTDLIREHVNEESIVGPLTFSDISRIKQIYSKKVVLLTNSECLSSCEIFAANLKDNSHVKIYGTDQSTYGSAANFLPSDTAIDFYLNDGNSIMPSLVEFRLAFKVPRRLSDNSLIEDVGVKSDEVIPLTKAEIINPSYSIVVERILSQF